MFLLHVKALKTLQKKKKTTGERVKVFSFSMRTFPFHLCNFLQTAENSFFFPPNIKAKILKQPVTEMKY